MRRDQRGTAESVQWAVLTPLLILLVIGGIQSAIWLHGKNLAQEAAASGAEAAALAGGSADTGRAVAERMTGDLREVRVTVTTSPTTVTVVVEGRTQTFVDLGQGRVRAQAEQPRERR